MKVCASKLRNFLFASFLVQGFLYSQNSIEKQADKLYKKMAFSEAIGAYKRYLQIEPEDKEAMCNLAHCYRLTGDSRAAETCYLKCLGLIKDHPELRFHYAQTLMMNGKLSQAIDQYDLYARENPNDSRGKRYVEWCNSINSYRKDSLNYIISPLSINTAEAEFGAIIFNEKLIFSSSRKDGLTIKEDKWTGEGFIDSYEISIDSQNMITDGVEKLAGKKSSKYHEGPASFTKDGRFMYLTRNISKESVGDEHIYNLRIYEYRHNGKSWGEEREILFGDKKNQSSIGHAAVSADGKLLVFTSDMGGGYGGKDLYLSYKKGNSWSEAQNLGPEINTEGDELFPWLHPDGTLYFASDGLGGFGGLDIYTARKTENCWAPPSNFGYPVNGSLDDFTIFLNDAKTDGFFASNRKGGMGGDDIYHFSKMATIEEPIANTELVSQTIYSAREPNLPSSQPSSGNESIILQTKLFLIGMVLHSKTFEPVPNAQVEIENLFSGIKKTQLTKMDGNFYFELEDGYEYQVRYLYQSRVLDEITVNTRNRPKGLKVLDGLLRGDPDASFVSETLSPKPVNDAVKRTQQDIILDTFQTASKDYGKSYFSSVDTETHTVIFPSYKEIPAPLKEVKPKPRTMDIASKKGLLFKIQIGAFQKSLNENSRFLSKLKGNYIRERGPGGTNRYLLGSFTNLKSAEEYLQYIQDLGYSDAFIAPYKDGKRLNIPAESAR